MNPGLDRGQERNGYPRIVNVVTDSFKFPLRLKLHKVRLILKLQLVFDHPLNKRLLPLLNIHGLAPAAVSKHCSRFLFSPSADCPDHARTVLSYKTDVVKTLGPWLPVLSPLLLIA